MGNCLRWRVGLDWCQRSLWVPWTWCCNRCFPDCFLWSRQWIYRFGWRLLLRWRNEYLWLWECGSWNPQLWSFRRCRCTMWKRRYEHGHVHDFAIWVGVKHKVFVPSRSGPFQHWGRGPHLEWTFDGFVVAPKCSYVNYLHWPKPHILFSLFFFIIIS